MKPAERATSTSEPIVRPERNGVIVKRRDVDDEARLRRLLSLLNEVLDSPDTPDEK